jgi:ATP-dependent RNA helicase DDX55/SPB4
MPPGKVASSGKSPRAWDGLSPALDDWILEAVSTMGFKQMTPVQAATLPHFLGNKDVVVEVGKSAHLFIAQLLILTL